jgi:hypothetical protein
VKLDGDVRSVGDAAGFRVTRDGAGRGLLKAHAGVRIFHYGFCRPPVLQRAKQISLASFYGETLAEDATPTPEAVFGRPDSLVRFDGRHPGIMRRRIASQSWHYDPDLPGARRRVARWLRDMVSVSARDVASRLAPIAATNLWWRTVAAFGARGRSRRKRPR